MAEATPETVDTAECQPECQPWCQEHHGDSCMSASHAVPKTDVLAWVRQHVGRPATVVVDFPGGTVELVVGIVLAMGANRGAR